MEMPATLISAWDYMNLKGQGQDIFEDFIIYCEINWLPQKR